MSQPLAGFQPAPRSIPDMMNGKLVCEGGNACTLVSGGEKVSLLLEREWERRIVVAVIHVSLSDQGRQTRMV
jgi:hypothetical protein